MANHLYIIGNGFDQHHDIHSGYMNYRKWLEDNDRCEILANIDNLFEFTNDDWWKHFEENLASVNTLHIATQKTSENYPDFGSDDFRDRDWYNAELETERYIDEQLDAIKDSFIDWARELPNGNPLKMLRIHKKDSLFMTFNYTNTLESLYKIPSSNILHIHGDALRDEELIIGHGLSYREIEKMMDENVDSGDYVFQCAKNAAVNSVANMRKPVEQIIRKHKDWFKKIKNISYLHIYGLSFSYIDVPYIKYILSLLDKSNIKYEISALTNDDKCNIINFFNKQHITLKPYNIVNLNNLVYAKQLVIPFTPH